MLELNKNRLQLWKLYTIPYSEAGRIDLIAYSQYGSTAYAKCILEYNSILCPYEVRTGINSNVKINDLESGDVIALPTIDSSNEYLKSLGYV